MQLRRCTWTVLLVVLFHITNTTPTQFRSDDYFYLDPEMDDDDVFGPDMVEADEQPNRYYFPPFPRFSEGYSLDGMGFAADTTTECETESPSPAESAAKTPHPIIVSPRSTTSTPSMSSTPAAPLATTCITVFAGVTQRPATDWNRPVTPAPTQQPTTTTVAPTTTPHPENTTTIATTTAAAANTTTPSSTTEAITSTESTTCIEEPEASSTTAHTTTPEATTKSAIEKPESTTCFEEGATPKPTTLPYPYLRPVEATTCMPLKNAPGGKMNGSLTLQALGLQLPQLQMMPPSPIALAEQEGKSRALHQLVQHLYVAQARVQLEAIEIKKAQAVANSAQQQLEEAANHVRSVTAALQNAQQEVASAAIRAQTAQLQLAAHDQLLFAARQDVDALSSQMVGLQAAEGISAPTVKFDIGGLLDKLKQPLPEAERPTAVPPVVALHDGAKAPAVYDDYDYD